MRQTQKSKGDLESSQNQEYLKTHIAPVIDQLVSTLVTSRPTNVIAFCSKYFQDLGQSPHQPQDSLDDDLEIAKQPVNSRRRKGILKPQNAQAVQDPNIVEKSQYDKSRILFACAQLFMFRSFGQEEMAKVINITTEVELAQNAILLQEGQEVDGLYLVNSGELLQSTSTNDRTRVFGSSSTIGQLSLLYDLKSTCTVKATTKSTLYKLDRRVYLQMAQTLNQRKRQIFEDIINQCAVFRTMSSLEKATLHTITTLDTICQGEPVGIKVPYSKFMIIVAQGKLQLSVRSNNQGNLVQVYSAGDQILPEIINKNMCSSVNTPCTLIYMDIEGFDRLFGPFERFVKRQKLPKAKSQSKQESR